MNSTKIFLVVAMFIGFACAGFACGGGGTEGSEYLPAHIVASWSGGAAGEPTDRTDTDATDWIGNICPASSVGLTNYGGEFAGLNIINNCTLTVTYALCVTKGSPVQPVNGLKECATDPFQTSWSQLTFKTLNNGSPGDFINATENLSINIFFCSDSMTLTGPPLRCL